VRSLCVITVGSVGREIGDRLARLRPAAHRRDATDGLDVSGLPPADAYVLAAGRQVAGLEQDLDAMVHDRRRALLTVAVEHPVLRLGPLVVPGSGAACATCYHGRYRTHVAGLDALDSLEAHYRERPHDEPAGFLPPMLDFAAAQAHGLLAAAAVDPSGRAGFVHLAHLLMPRLYRWTVVGVHGCPRCGSGRDERERSSGRLVEAVAVALAASGGPVREGALR